MSDAKKAKKSIVIVTGNKNKLAEFKQILGNEFPYEVSSDGETELWVGRRFSYYILILCISVINVQSCRNRSSYVEPVLSCG